MNIDTPYDDAVNIYEQKLEDLKRKRNKWRAGNYIWVIIGVGKPGEKDKRLFESHSKQEAIDWALENTEWEMVNDKQFVNKNREKHPGSRVDGLLRRELL